MATTKGPNIMYNRHPAKGKPASLDTDLAQPVVSFDSPSGGPVAPDSAPNRPSHKFTPAFSRPSVPPRELAWGRMWIPCLSLNLSHSWMLWKSVQPVVCPDPCNASIRAR